MRDNRTFLNSFSSEEYSCWAAVVAFYTAVHLVERLRALDGGHSTNHNDRRDYIIANHREIHDAYRQLDDAGWLARYGSNADFFKKVSNADVKGVLIDGYLVAIEDYVERYITERSAPPKA